MAEKIEKRIEEVCERMLFSARSELYLHLRFLDVALSMFSYALEPNLETIGSDGRIIYYNPAGRWHPQNAGVSYNKSRAH